MSDAQKILNPTVSLPDGTAVPTLGAGTWNMGENPRSKATEVDALRHSLDLGMTLIDTAEMYGDGGAEEVVGEAIRGRRHEAFIVSKVYPQNASRDGVIAACERSLRRMRTDRIDLYLLHWRGSHPLAETIEGFKTLVKQGKIGNWGVSNFDTADMKELFSIPHGDRCAVNQVLYNIGRRGIEYDLMPWCVGNGIPIMAYSPIEQGRLASHPALIEIAKAHNATPAQVALAFVLQHFGVIAIPKASNKAHVEENVRALALRLLDDEWQKLNDAFPAPTKARPLEML